MSAETVETVPPTQQRKKPIRTYGRRSSAAVIKAESKPSTPRQLSREDIPAPQLPPPSSSETVPLSIEYSKPNAPKSSILSYFKAKPKTTAAQSKATTPAPPTATEELVSTPPSPPPSSTGQRKRRRLTTRPIFYDGYDGENTDSKRRKEENGDEAPQTENGGTPIGTPSASQTETDSTSTTGQIAAKKKRTTKTPTKEMAQTTLSLAIGDPKPQFIVCKECSMLYNHLNDKDRRDHKRVHAAYIRSRSRSKNREDSDST